MSNQTPKYSAARDESPRAVQNNNDPGDFSYRGFLTEPDDFRMLVEDAMNSLPAGPYRVDSSLDLTAAERAVLQAGGMDLTAHDLAHRDPLSRASAEYIAMLDACFTVRQAADTLGVTPARVRQLLTDTPRRLVGIKGRAGWRIPAFQFTQNGIVPGWDDVVPALHADLHPLAVLHFATRANTDLVIADDRCISPLDWLFTGRDPQVVHDLAAAL